MISKQMGKYKYVNIFLGVFLTFFISCQTDSTPESKENTYKGVSNIFEYLDSEETGIQFSNEMRDSFLMNILYYEYAYNGSGVAIGDINNDGLQDVYLSGSMEPGKLYLNMGDFKFRDITAPSGLRPGPGIKTGVCMVDVNNDGYLDIYITKSGNTKVLKNRENVLFVNNQDLTFKESAKEYNLNDNSYGTQAYFADIDLDGDLDMFMGNHPVDWGKQDQLNIDIDDQGKYYVVQDTQRQFISDRLYINEGGRFVDKTFEYKIDNIAFCLSAVFTDVNNDGYPDIYICNDYVAPDALYVNKGGKYFENEILDYFDNISTSSMGSDVFDINNDGEFDFFTSDMMGATIDRIRVNNSFVNYDAHLLAKSLDNHDQFRYNALQVKMPDGKFSNLNFLSDTDNTDWSWAALAADYDHNGHTDIFVTNGYPKDVNNLDYAKFLFDSIKKHVAHEDFFTVWTDEVAELPLKNYFYSNEGNYNITDVSDQWGRGRASVSNAAAFGDLDNDGDLDLIVNNINDEVFIVRNNLDERKKTSYLALNLFQEGPNRFALGTTVKLTLNNRMTMLRYYNPIRGYMSSNEYRVHFGFADSLYVKELAVRWPTGEEESFGTIEKDQLHTIVKGQGSPTSFKRSTQPKKYTKSDFPFNHIEDSFIDFKREPFLHLKNSAEGPVVKVGDLNGDGVEDVFFGGSSIQSSKVFLATKNGDWKITDSGFSDDVSYEDTDASFLDFDADGDLDILVSSGGYRYEADSDNYQLRLYENDGSGRFQRNTEAIPNIKTNSYCLIQFDYDKDGDKDIFIGAGPKINYYPDGDKSFLLKNEGNSFVDVTSEILPDNGYLGIVKDAELIDINGAENLVLVGDWSEVRILSFESGKGTEITDQTGLSETNGLWQKVYVDDVDGDGDQDIIAGNLGKNSFFKTSKEKPTCIYSYDFDHNGENDPVMCTYYGDKSYPIYSRDELLNQMTTLRKKYLRYHHYSREGINEIFDPEDVKKAKVYIAYIFESSVFFNENGKFVRQVLPIECQLSMVKDIEKIGDNRYAVIGNFWDTDFDYGKYDASIGAIVTFEDNSVSVEDNAGFIVDGNAREIEKINLSNRTCWIIGENNSRAYLYCKN